MLMRDHSGMWIHYGMLGVNDSRIISEVLFDQCYRLHMVEHNVKTVVDVGAHVGAFAVAAHKKWPHAAIVCVEPVEDNVECLRENVGSFADVRRQALCPLEFATIWIPKIQLNTWSGSTTQFDDCYCERVPSFWPSQIDGVIDVLKLDCEGAEYDVLNDQSLMNVRTVVGELHDSSRWDEVVNAMPSWDMTVTSHEGKTLLFHATKHV